MGLFGSSGVRGVVNEELTAGDVLRLAAVVTSHWGADHVAVGRDTRIASEAYANAASSGAASVGATVDRVGVIPTPGFQRYLRSNGLPGMMITASHNPPRYTGVKLFDAEGIELGGTRLDAVETVLAEDRWTPVDWAAVGTERRVEGAVEDYIDAVRRVVDEEAIAAAEPTVVIDPGHGAGCGTTARLCRDLGCRVITLNDTPDGRFPGRQPEPIPAVLDDLCTLVNANDADLGVAHDGDADRAVFVDENGAVVPGDSVLALLAAAFVEPGDAVVAAVNASDRLAAAVEANGGRLERTPIGSAAIVSRVRELMAEGTSVPVAGEGNGGIFLPDHGLVRDGLLVTAVVLGMTVERPLAVRAEEHTGYHLVRRELPYESVTEREQILEALEQLAAEAPGPVNRTDGVRIERDDGWTLARASGTEPVIRVVAESGDPDRAARYADELIAAITDGEETIFSTRENGKRA